MAKKAGKDYFGLPWLVSFFVTRFKEGHWVCGLVRLVFGWNIIWILDIIFMIFTHHIFKLF